MSIDNRILMLLDAKTLEDVYAAMDAIDKDLFDSLCIAQNNPYHKYNVRDHIAFTVLNTPRDFETRVAAIFHDIGKRDALTTTEDGRNHFYGHEKISAKLAEPILDRLSVSGEEKENILNLIRYHDHYNRDTPTRPQTRKIVSILGPETARKWVGLKRADMLAQSEKSIREKSFRILLTESLVGDTIEDKTAIRAEDLDLTEEDKKEISEKTIEVLLKSCWGTPNTNRRDTLLRIARTCAKHPPKG